MGRISKEEIALGLLFVIVFGLHLGLSLQAQTLTSDSYFVLRQAEHIRDTGPAAVQGPVKLFRPHPVVPPSVLLHCGSVLHVHEHYTSCQDSAGLKHGCFSHCGLRNLKADYQEQGGLAHSSIVCRVCPCLLCVAQQSLADFAKHSAGIPAGIRLPEAGGKRGSRPSQSWLQYLQSSPLSRFSCSSSGCSSTSSYSSWSAPSQA